MVSSPQLLLICPGYPPPFVGGAKVYLCNMVENSPGNFDILTSALKEGCQEVSSPRHTIFRNPKIYDSNVRDPNTWDLFVSYTTIIFWFLNRSRKVRYDAVVVNGLTFLNGIFFLLLKAFRIPAIGIVYGEEFTQSFKGKGVKNFIKRLFIRITQTKATGFISVCDFGKEVLTTLGISPRQIDVVPCSINPKKLLPLHKKKRGFKVLSVGRLIERKGFHCLMEAVSRLKKELPEIELNIVGDGPYKPILLKKLAQDRLGDFVSIRDKVTDEELSRLYRESDLFVLAHMMLENGDTEGCPTVYAEASGCGLPVIGGTGGGAATIIEEGKTGFIVETRDIDTLAARIKLLLTNPSLAEQMGQRGSEKVRRDHLPQKTGVDFYESVCRLAEIA